MEWREKKLVQTGSCPIEGQVEVRSIENGFVVVLPFCSGYDFVWVYAQFVFSEKYIDFAFAGYHEEVINKLSETQEEKVVKYDVNNEVPILIGNFSPITIRQSGKK